MLMNTHQTIWGEIQSPPDFEKCKNTRVGRTPIFYLPDGAKREARPPHEFILAQARYFAAPLQVRTQRFALSRGSAPRCCHAPLLRSRYSRTSQ